ncbi:SDR family oxidoreductase [Mesorhizobium sp. M0902]|uniref:SDR family oxidoreductase n=1 Tax=Mesorhizobium sp. M0902 TaxID=2957021 RepID=UPI0033385A52
MIGSKLTPPRSLKDRVALVTGAAGGLGKAIVSDLQSRGAIVYGVDVSGDGVIHTDLSTTEGNRDIISHVLNEAGRLDILVLNAGCQFTAPIDQFPDEEWDRLRAVMLDGPFQAIKAAWSALSQSRAGRIIVTASPLSWSGAPHKAAYTAAKHGVMGLVRTAALEGAKLGITANAVAPGWMDTGLMRGQLDAQAARRGKSVEEVVELFRADQPADRFVEVSEVAAVIGFLAGPGASAVSGTCIPVDLGACAQ